MPALDHIEIYVSNLQRSDAFWKWLLLKMGFTEFQRWEQGRSYSDGHCYLVFVQAEDRFLPDGYHRKRVGLNHLAFRVETREMVDHITEELSRRDVPVLYGDRHPHAGGRRQYAAYFEDPDRIKVEVVLEA